MILDILLVLGFAAPILGGYAWAEYNWNRRIAYKPNLELEEVQEDENIKALEQMYVDGDIETVEELDHRVSLVLDPEARAEEEKKQQYQSDWVMAIHHNNMLDQIAEQRRLDEEYFFEHGKPRPKPIIVQPQRQSSASAYVTAVSYGYGSAATLHAPVTVSPARYYDVRPTDDRPKWAKQADDLRNRGVCVVDLTPDDHADWGEDVVLSEGTAWVGATLSG